MKYAFVLLQFHLHVEAASSAVILQHPWVYPFGLTLASPSAPVFEKSRVGEMNDFSAAWLVVQPAFALCRPDVIS
ncbi:hypothetical protein D3C78_1542620 [compost metagenome]